MRIYRQVIVSFIRVVGNTITVGCSSAFMDENLASTVNGSVVDLPPNKVECNSRVYVPV